MSTQYVNAALRTAIVAGGLAILGACSTNLADVGPGPSIGYQNLIQTQTAAVREYRACRDDAVQMATQARQSASLARYFASARIVETCEAALGNHAAAVPDDERMKAYALSVQNYFKGGDIVASRRTLANFQAAFAGYDLYMPDGASFIETYEILLGLRARNNPAAYTAANVGEPLKDELRRVHYWLTN